MVASTIDPAKVTALLGLLFLMGRLAWIERYRPPRPERGRFFLMTC
jgi:hypothetical protein